MPLPPLPRPGLDQRRPPFAGDGEEAEIELRIEDFDVISQRTPLLADMKPWGRFTAVDLYNAGEWRCLRSGCSMPGCFIRTRPTTGLKTLEEKRPPRRSSLGRRLSGSFPILSRTRAGL